MIADDIAGTARTLPGHAGDPHALDIAPRLPRNYRPAPPLTPSLLATLGYLQPTLERPYNLLMSHP